MSCERPLCRDLWSHISCDLYEVTYIMWHVSCNLFFLFVWLYITFNMHMYINMYINIQYLLYCRLPTYFWNFESTYFALSSGLVDGMHTWLGTFSSPLEVCPVHSSGILAQRLISMVCRLQQNSKELALFICGFSCCVSHNKRWAFPISRYTPNEGRSYTRKFVFLFFIQCLCFLKISLHTPPELERWEKPSNLLLNCFLFSWCITRDGV